MIQRVPDDRGFATPASFAHPCLTEDEALVFINAKTDSTTVPETLSHIESCSRCRRLIGEAARLQTIASRPTLDTGHGARLAGRFQLLDLATDGTQEAFDHQTETMVALRSFTIRENEATSVVEVATRLRGLRHPHVRPLLDFAVEVPKGGAGRWVILAMPLDQGISLPDVPDAAAPMSADRVARLVGSTLDGLMALHAEGLGHGAVSARDLVVGGDATDGDWIAVDVNRPAWLLGGSDVALEIRSLGALTRSLLLGLAADPKEPLGRVARPWRTFLTRCSGTAAFRRFRSLADVRRALPT